MLDKSVTKKLKLVHVVGARPNFIKLAPVHSAFQSYEDIEQVIIHTGQHYDYKMSEIFFEEFGMPQPDVNLSIGGGSVLKQLGAGIMKLEEEIPKYQPDLVMIYGDINATASTSIVCAKLGIKIGHVEAGLRSFDRTMPEETNRIIADSLSDFFFTPSRDANINLKKAGVSDDQIFLVGNVMIDTLVNFLPLSEEATFPFPVPGEYGLATLHRPSNVDDPVNLKKTLETLRDLSEKCPIVFPVHPRTRANISDEFLNGQSRLIITEPLGYLAFLKLQKNAKFVITDSGGIQEETTYLGIPCFTLRNNTERPVTVDVGTNILVGTDVQNLARELQSFLGGKRKKASIPDYWDGKASRRIAEIVHAKLEQLCVAV